MLVLFLTAIVCVAVDDALLHPPARTGDNDMKAQWDAASHDCSKLWYFSNAYTKYCLGGRMGINR